MAKLTEKEFEGYDSFECQKDDVIVVLPEIHCTVYGGLKPDGVHYYYNGITPVVIRGGVASSAKIALNTLLPKIIREKGGFSQPALEFDNVKFKSATNLAEEFDKRQTYGVYRVKEMFYGVSISFTGKQWLVNCPLLRKEETAVENGKITIDGKEFAIETLRKLFEE